MRFLPRQEHSITQGQVLDGTQNIKHFVIILALKDTNQLKQAYKFNCALQKVVLNNAISIKCLI